MSDFSSLWDSAADLMDGAVDNLLGDRIRYKRATDADFVVIEGFVVIEVAGETVEENDEIVSSIPRLKVAKTTIAHPSLADRIQHPKLGSGTYRPLGSDPQTQGRYWVFDVQKVSA